MNRIAVTTSPFNCRWIAPTLEGHSPDPHYAICLRPPKGPRVVNEPECAFCPKWEPPDQDEPARRSL
jgi:hypothetical protein